MALEADILNWDGKSAADIEAVYRTHCGDDGFVHALVSLAGKPGCQSAATWLLKHHMEKTGQAPPAGLVARLLKLACDMPSWEARLHVLQIFDALVFTDGMVDDAFQFASDCTDDHSTFCSRLGLLRTRGSRCSASASPFRSSRTS